MDVYQHVKFSYLLTFSPERKSAEIQVYVFTTSHMRRTLARENFTSARRRRVISLSMLKVPINTPKEIPNTINQ